MSPMAEFEFTYLIWKECVVREYLFPQTEKWE